MKNIQIPDTSDGGMSRFDHNFYENENTKPYQYNKNFRVYRAPIHDEEILESDTLLLPSNNQSVFDTTLESSRSFFKIFSIKCNSCRLIIMVIVIFLVLPFLYYIFLFETRH